MSNLPDFTQTNEQILNDIQSLLAMENQLSNTLETNHNLTASQKQDIVNQMSNIYNMCINLYSTLSNVNNFYGNAMNASVSTLKEQTTAIAVIENELNLSKQRLQILQEETSNKVRLVEINDYYGQRYSEHAKLMKIIIFVLVPIIVLAILNSKGFLNAWIYYSLVCIIAFIGAIYFWKQLVSVIYRDNMNYNEYNWKFNPSTAPPPNLTGSANNSDPWSVSIPNIGTCIGEACCASTDMWNSSQGQCVPTNSTESFVNTVLTQGSSDNNTYTIDGDNKIKAYNS